MPFRHWIFRHSTSPTLLLALDFFDRPIAFSRFLRLAVLWGIFLTSTARRVEAGFVLVELGGRLALDFLDRPIAVGRASRGRAPGAGRRSWFCSLLFLVGPFFVARTYGVVDMPIAAWQGAIVLRQRVSRSLWIDLRALVTWHCWAVDFGLVLDKLAKEPKRDHRKNDQPQHPKFRFRRRGRPSCFFEQVVTHVITLACWTISAELLALAC